MNQQDELEELKAYYIAKWTFEESLPFEYLSERERKVVKDSFGFTQWMLDKYMEQLKQAIMDALKSSWIIKKLRR